jgi:competence protein ComEC
VSKNNIGKKKMKKIIIVLMLAGLLLTSSCAVNSLREQPPIENETYEAEQAELLDGIAVRDDSSASGGKFIQMKDTGSVIFHVDVEQEGLYELLIGYRAPDSDKAQRILINEKEYAPQIGFLISPTWTQATKIAGLKAGANKIELKKDWGYMDIDYLTVRGPVKVMPEISPVRNTFYKVPAATDLFIKLDKNANKLISIMNNVKKVPYEDEDVWYTEDSKMIKIPAAYLQTLSNGVHEILFNFEDIEPLKFELEVRDTAKDSELTIISLDVRHGASVLVIFPTGKTLLIDTGTEEMCKKQVIPFIDRHNIALDYLYITHYHDDHCGGKQLIEEKYKDLIVKDYKDFKTGQEFELEKTKVTILNSYDDGDEENTRSLSFRIEYKGFVYTHGGDIYGDNQRRILQQYKAMNDLNALRTHVYHANHHFHGSVDAEYLRTIDPYLIIVSAEEHVYGRAAYTQTVQRDVLPYLKKNNKRLIEDLLHFEVGHVIVRVKNGTNWGYETYKDLDALVPFLKN